MKSSAFAPAEYRLIADERIKYLFWIKDYDEYDSCNILGILRISYMDMFSNLYYQDLLFSYDEEVYDQSRILEIDNVKVPILQSEAKSLFESIKIDYPDFMEIEEN